MFFFWGFPRVVPGTLQPAPRILKVTLRSDFTLTTENHSYWHANETDYHRAWDGRCVGSADVDIVGTTVSGKTNAQGKVDLDISSLADGAYTLRVRADQTSLDPQGPAINPNPPVERIYRPLDVRIDLQDGNLTSITILPVTLTDGSTDTTHAKVGNTVLRDWTAKGAPRHLPLDIKPVWMNSRRRGNAITPTLIVVHHTSGAEITGALNWLPSPPLPPPEAYKNASAHYLIGVDGHIVKMNPDTNDGWHAGASHWGVRGVNDFAVGIEIVHGEGEFPEAQYVALEGLIGRLISDLNIERHRVVGHSDIAIVTKKPDGTTGWFFLGAKHGDPGTEFEWERLENRGWGLRPAPEDRFEPDEESFFANDNLLTDGEKKSKFQMVLRSGDNDATSKYGGRHREGVTGKVKEIQTKLNDIGYFINVDGQYTDKTQRAVQTFQMHFFSGSRRSMGRQDGSVDRTTAEWISRVRRTLA